MRFRSTRRWFRAHNCTPGRSCPSQHRNWSSGRWAEFFRLRRPSAPRKTIAQGLSDLCKARSASASEPQMQNRARSYQALSTIRRLPRLRLSDGQIVGEGEGSDSLDGFIAGPVLLRQCCVVHAWALVRSQQGVLMQLISVNLVFSPEHCGYVDLRGCVSLSKESGASNSVTFAA